MTTPSSKPAIDKESSAAYSYLPGKNAQMDAWFTSFIIENHLDYFTNPEHAATDEQVRFMVYTAENERYYPCSDQMFAAIMGRKQSAFMQKHYQDVLHRVVALVDRQIEEPYEKAYLESLLLTKFKHETRDEIMIPSRLEKRLMQIYLRRTHIEDPYLEEKTQRNFNALQVLDLPAFQEALNYVDRSALEKPPATLSEIKAKVASVEFQRLLLSANTPLLWESDRGLKYSRQDFLDLFEKPIKGDGKRALFEFVGFGRKGTTRKMILWLADESGQVIMDIALIRFLITLGHKVIIAFKEGPLYTKTDIVDLHDDVCLKNAMGKAITLENPKMSKNELVKTLRGDVPLLAMSDGTSENTNLQLASISFARMFKEVDGVISRGPDQRRRFFDTHFKFTQDIYSIADEKDGGLSILFKPRHPAVIKFSHNDLESRAQSIINRMKEAKAKGMTVIFYSGIIGSIPGKVKMAKQVMSVFVEHLKKQSTLTFIINPSEHFEPGMDADDLMYMWEIVQRSGIIDIWRFQSYEDIVKAFELMQKKVPPEWVGKDATYSTGCTKEMDIALEVQRIHPEMQIIGPAKERFMRRKEYGVGKMYDQRLALVC